MKSELSIYFAKCTEKLIKRIAHNNALKSYCTTVFTIMLGNNRYFCRQFTGTMNELKHWEQKNNIGTLTNPNTRAMLVLVH